MGLRHFACFALPRRVVEDAEIMRLAREDQIRFAEALINPPKANERLARAA